MRSKSEQLAQIRVAATCPVSEIEDSPAMALTYCYDYHHHHPDDVLNEVSGKIGTSAESKVNPGPCWEGCRWLDGPVILVKPECYQPSW